MFEIWFSSTLIKSIRQILNNDNKFMLSLEKLLITWEMQNSSWNSLNANHFRVNTLVIKSKNILNCLKWFW
jgi:hypothetical protein